MVIRLMNTHRVRELKMEDMNAADYTVDYTNHTHFWHKRLSDLLDALREKLNLLQSFGRFESIT